MANLVNTVPVWDYEKEELVLDSEGFVETITDGTSMEVTQRLQCRRGSYIHDPEYGSTLYEIINNRNINITQNAIKVSVLEALNPMVRQGKIDSSIQVISNISAIQVKVFVTVKDSQGKVINAIFSSFITS